MKEGKCSLKLLKVDDDKSKEEKKENQIKLENNVVYPKEMDKNINEITTGNITSLFLII